MLMEYCILSFVEFWQINVDTRTISEGFSYFRFAYDMFVTQLYLLALMGAVPKSL